MPFLTPNDPKSFFLDNDRRRDEGLALANRRCMWACVSSSGWALVGLVGVAYSGQTPAPGLVLGTGLTWVALGLFSGWLAFRRRRDDREHAVTQHALVNTLLRDRADAAVRAMAKVRP